MDIVDRLEFKHLLNPDALLREAADVISSERLVADKLHRALILSFDDSPAAVASTAAVIQEALNCYEMARLDSFD